MPNRTLTTWPAPDAEPASPDFRLVVENQPIFVYTARVREEIFEAKDTIWTHKPGCKADLASFALFDFTGPVEVVITPTRPFQSASIHPLSAGIVPTLSAGTIRFTMDQPRPLTLMLDDSDDVVLHLFAHEPERDAPKKDDPNVVYFGPGYHDITTLTLTSGQTLYLAGGAILRARLDPAEQPTVNQRTGLKHYKGAIITAANAHDVRVMGRGIIDAAALPHAARATLVSSKSHRVRFEGLTIRNSANWQVIVWHSSDVEVTGLNVLGGRFNTDGINSVSSHFVRIHHCFVRSHDDSLAVKTTQPDAPASDILVDSCVVWNDWGYALGVTYETRSDISHVTFRNCDILCARHHVLGVHVVDAGTVSDIAFENIRIENLANAAKRWKQTPILIRVGITKDMWGTDKEPGHVKKVRFDNITLQGSAKPHSQILGHSAQGLVEDVTLANLNYLGKHVTQPADANLRVNEFVRDLRMT